MVFYYETVKSARSVLSALASLHWIFSFEKDDEDSYGMIENNTETQEFSNYFRRLKPEEYNVVARSVLDYIIMMGGFGQR